MTSFDFLYAQIHHPGALLEAIAMAQPPRFLPAFLRQAPATEFWQQQPLESYTNEV